MGRTPAGPLLASRGELTSIPSPRRRLTPRGWGERARQTLKPSFFANSSQKEWLLLETLRLDHTGHLGTSHPEDPLGSWREDHRPGPARRWPERRRRSPAVPGCRCCSSAPHGLLTGAQGAHATPHAPPFLLWSSSRKSLEMVPEKRDVSMWNKGLVNLDLKTMFTNQPRDFYMEPGTFSPYSGLCRHSWK